MCVCVCVNTCSPSVAQTWKKHFTPTVFTMLTRAIFLFGSQQQCTTAACSSIDIVVYNGCGRVFPSGHADGEEVTCVPHHRLIVLQQPRADAFLYARACIIFFFRGKKTPIFIVAPSTGIFRFLWFFIENWNLSYRIRWVLVCVYELWFCALVFFFNGTFFVYTNFGRDGTKVCLCYCLCESPYASYTNKGL